VLAAAGLEKAELSNSGRQATVLCQLALGRLGRDHRFNQHRPPHSTDVTLIHSWQQLEKNWSSLNMQKFISNFVKTSA
jgi:hypothetical protein